MEEIKSDVDRIIEILRATPERYFPIAELAARTGLTPLQIRKWIGVLEAGGRTRLRYALTQEEVAWLEPGLHLRHPRHGEDGKPPVPAPVRATGSFYPIAHSSMRMGGRIAGLGADAPAMEPGAGTVEASPVAAKELDELRRVLSETVSSEALAEGPVAQESETSPAGRPQEKESENAPLAKEAPAQGLRKNGGPKTDEKETEAAFSQEKALSKIWTARTATGPAPESADFGPAPSGIVRLQTVELGPESRERLLAPFEPVDFPAPVKWPPMPEADRQAVKFSNKLSAALSRIKAKTDEISHLKEEKRRLMREVYRPLERKMEGDLETVVDALVKYENRLLTLRARLAELPEAVAGVSERQEKLAAVAGEMRKTYDETVHLLDEALAALLESRERAALQVDSVREGVREQETQIGQMGRLLNEVASMHAQANGQLEAARGAMEEQEAQMGEAEGALKKIVSLRQSIGDDVGKARDEVRRQKQTLTGLDSHLLRVNEVARWVARHRSEYDERMRHLAEYIRSADDEYAHLRESVEGGFVRRHIRELHHLSESYQYELAQAERVEENIDQQISSAKSELGELIEKAKRVEQMEALQLQEMGQGRPRTEPALAHHAMFNTLSAADRERARIRNTIRALIEMPEASAGGRPGAKIPRRPKETAAKSRKQKKPGRRR